MLAATYMDSRSTPVTLLFARLTKARLRGWCVRLVHGSCRLAVCHTVHVSGNAAMFDSHVFSVGFDCVCAIQRYGRTLVLHHLIVNHRQSVSEGTAYFLHLLKCKCFPSNLGMSRASMFGLLAYYHSTSAA